MTNYDRIISMNIEDIEEYVNRVKFSIFNSRTGENYKNGEDFDIIDISNWLGKEEEING